MNTKKKMSNKSIRGVIWHDIARGFYADRFRYLIVVLMLAGVLIILGNHEFGMMDTIFLLEMCLTLIFLLIMLLFQVFPN